MAKKGIKKYCRILIIHLFFLSSFVWADELSRLQQAIHEQTKKVETKTQSHTEQQQAIQDLQQKMQELAKNQHQLENSLKENQQKQQQLSQQEKKLNSQMVEQKKHLAEIISTIYKARLNPSLLERLFSQQAEKTQIAKQYWLYLYQQKKNLLQQLQQTENALAAQQQKLNEQKTLVEKEQSELSQIHQQHQQTENDLKTHLAQLAQQLAEEKKQLDQLMANEKALREKIKRAEEEAKRLSDQKRFSALLAKAKQGLGEGKKQLTFPVKGRVLHEFNSVQLGELRWRGLVVQAQMGEKIHAVFAGQVIFAGFLAGYGQMVILKHGETDLSLYGYQRQLFVKTGDVVDTGRVIGEVGQISGENQSGLYFEISRKGEGVDPLNWLNKDKFYD